MNGRDQKTDAQFCIINASTCSFKHKHKQTKTQSHNILTFMVLCWNSVWQLVTSLALK